MTAFWLSAVALTVVALELVLRPLLWRKSGAQVSRATANVSVHRDALRELDADLAAGKIARADYERARVELEARLLEDVRRPDEPAAPAPRRRLALALGVALPVLAAALYFLTGNPGALQREAEHAQTVAQLDAMVERLADKLRANPDDAEGWKLLARSYSALGRYEDAAQAYAKAAARAPRDAQLLADFADALAMARGRRLAGEPEKLVLHALAIDPNNLKALALAGTAAFERQDYRGAAAYWQRMLPLVAEESEDARAIRSSIEEARSLIAPGAGAADAARGEARQGARAAARFRARRLHGDGAWHAAIELPARRGRRAHLQVGQREPSAGRPAGSDRRGRERRDRRQRRHRHPDTLRR